MSENSNAPVQTVPLHALHLELGARMVPFAGYQMPLQYPAGIKQEHLHTRGAAGLFDVSHMGQVRITGDNRVAAIESLVPGDVAGLSPGQMRYTQLTNDDCGILDDLMITNLGDQLFLVVNGACKDTDLAHMQNRIGDQVTIEHLTGRSLLALQGPEAAISCLRWSHNGNWLAVTGFECGVPICDTKKRQDIRRLQGHCADLRALAFSPDESLLYIADTGVSHDVDGPQHIRRHKVEADGTLSGGEVFATSTQGLFDGFRVDADGRIWTSAADGVHCLNSEGELIGKIRIPEIVSNVCFGGPKLNRLFICGTTSLYSAYLAVNGVSPV